MQMQAASSRIMLQSTHAAADAAVHALSKAHLPVPARATGARDIMLQPAGRSGRSHGCGGSRCAGMGANEGGSCLLRACFRGQRVPACAAFPRSHLMAAGNCHKSSSARLPLFIQVDCIASELQQLLPDGNAGHQVKSLLFPAMRGVFFRDDMWR